MEDEILNELNVLIEEYDSAAPAIDDRWMRLLRGSHLSFHLEHDDHNCDHYDRDVYTPDAASRHGHTTIRRPEPEETRVAARHTATAVQASTTCTASTTRTTRVATHAGDGSVTAATDTGRSHAGGNDRRSPFRSSREPPIQDVRWKSPMAYSVQPRWYILTRDTIRQDHQGENRMYLGSGTPK